MPYSASNRSGISVGKSDSVKVKAKVVAVLNQVPR
jgi:hypothetical protein